MTRSRDDLDALMRSVDDTLARPRPADGSSWTQTPLATKTATPDGKTLDIIAKGFGEALGLMAKAMSERMTQLETRIEELEKRHD